MAAICVLLFRAAPDRCLSIKASAGRHLRKLHTICSRKMHIQLLIFEIIIDYLADELLIR
jgi:hypothetical protein